MRLFAAVVPPPEVLEHLELALRTVRGVDGGKRGPLRWTDPGDRHLTLAFYGGVPDGYLDEVTRALDDVAAVTAPFGLALRGAGVFDGRTLWVGCTGEVDALQALMAGAAAVGTVALRREPDHRSRAHLTVARVRSRSRRGGGRPGERRQGGPRPGERPGAWGGGSHPMGPREPGAVAGTGAEPADVHALAHALAVYEGPAWTVRELVLMASDLGAGRGGAPRYDVVHRAPLAAVAG